MKQRIGKCAFFIFLPSIHDKVSEGIKDLNFPCGLVANCGASALLPAGVSNKYLGISNYAAGFFAALCQQQVDRMHYMAGISW